MGQGSHSAVFMYVDRVLDRTTILCILYIYNIWREIIMDIIISNHSDSPIYEQIKEQLKVMIVRGELKEGDALPSMRLLAKELRISIITTKRAYEELEREGYIESYTGRGSFVSAVNRERVREEAVFEIEQLLEEALDKAKIAGISLSELEERMKLLYEDKEKQGNE